MQILAVQNHRYLTSTGNLNKKVIVTLRLENSFKIIMKMKKGRKGDLVKFTLKVMKDTFNGSG